MNVVLTTKMHYYSLFVLKDIVAIIAISMLSRNKYICVFMGRAIKKETIKNFCSKMLSDGFTSLDLKSDWECRPYPITCRYKLSCDDGTQQEIELVYGEWDGKLAVLLWSFIEDKYVEDLIRYFGDGNLVG